MRFLIKVKPNRKKDYLKEINSSDIKVEYIFQKFPILCVEVENEELLGNMSFVEHFELDDTYQVQRFQMLPNVRINKIKAKGLTGSGAVVGVIDSGMNPDEVNISDSKVFSASGSSHDAMVQGKLHGTIVGKIIHEIAPWSKIINLKVADDSTDIRKSSILKALDYAYVNNIKIINISLGKKQQCSKDCLVCNTLNQMVQDGFVIVAAIGNYGQEGEGITACPGNAEKAFTVGAVDLSKQNIANYSSVALPASKKPNIIAPGCVVNGGPEHITGTSFAAPFVTGVVASLSQQFSITHIVDNITKTAQNIGLPFHKQGHGLIHIENLLGVLKDEENIS